MSIVDTIVISRDKVSYKINGDTYSVRVPGVDKLGIDRNAESFHKYEVDSPIYHDAGAGFKISVYNNMKEEPGPGASFINYDLPVKNGDGFGVFLNGMFPGGGSSTVGSTTIPWHL